MPASSSRPSTRSPISTHYWTRATPRPAGRARALVRPREGPRFTAGPRPGAVLVHVLGPELDHVAVWVGDVDGPIGAELNRPLHLDSGAAEPLEQRVELLAVELEREVDVGAAAAAGESPLRGPQAEPRA